MNLESTTVNTLYQTVLEQFNQQDKEISSNTASSFVHYTIYQNPVWDLGLQHKLLSMNFNKDYSMNLTDIQRYTNNCVCPCSAIFNKWHQKKGIHEMSQFEQCDSPIFTDITSFVKHVYLTQDCYYHRIVMRIIQNVYSPLICKLHIKNDMKETKQTKFSITHDIKVKLPPYLESKCDYQSYRLKK